MNRKVKIIVLAGLLALVIFVLLFPYIFPEQKPMPKQEQGEAWKVYKEVYITSKNGPTITDSRELRLVLGVKNKPGPIDSMGILPPDGTVKMHSFLSAYSYDVFEEDALLGLLEKAKSFDEFMVLLKENGYILEKVEQEQ
ncbi:MAG: hypothetical protein AABW99_04970 [archaeon]